MTENTGANRDVLKHLQEFTQIRYFEFFFRHLFADAPIFILCPRCGKFRRTSKGVSALNALPLNTFIPRFVK